MGRRPTRQKVVKVFVGLEHIRNAPLGPSLVPGLETLEGTMWIVCLSTPAPGKDHASCSWAGRHPICPAGASLDEPDSVTAMKTGTEWTQDPSAPPPTPGTCVNNQRDALALHTKPHRVEGMKTSTAGPERQQAWSGFVFNQVFITFDHGNK